MTFRGVEYFCTQGLAETLPQLYMDISTFRRKQYKMTKMYHLYMRKMTSIMSILKDT